MPLTIEEVEHIAWLARLGLTREEKEAMARQLGQILDYFQMLNEVDTEEVRPTSHSLPLHNVFRADVAGVSFPREELLANAPDRDEKHFLVPRVVEE